MSKLESMTILLERLKKLEANASPGPWEHTHIYDGHDIIGFGPQLSYEDTERYHASVERYEDAALIVETRNALPKIIKQLEERTPHEPQKGGCLINVSPTVFARFNNFMNEKSGRGPGPEHAHGWQH